MRDSVDIIRDRITRPSYRPVDPKHWIVRIIHDTKGHMTEFKRGGIMTEDGATQWARCLIDDYPDAIEIVLYELTRTELDQYRNKGWS